MNCDGSEQRQVNLHQSGQASIIGCRNWCWIRHARLLVVFSSRKVNRCIFPLLHFDLIETEALGKVITLGYLWAISALAFSKPIQFVYFLFTSSSISSYSSSSLNLPKCRWRPPSHVGPKISNRSVKSITGKTRYQTDLSRNRFPITA